MSLILDALRRAERESRLEQGKELASVIRQGPARRHISFRGGMFLALLALACAGSALLAGFLLKGPETQHLPRPETSVVNAVRPLAVRKTRPSPAVSPRPVPRAQRAPQRPRTIDDASYSRPIQAPPGPKRPRPARPPVSAPSVFEGRAEKRNRPVAKPAPPGNRSGLGTQVTARANREIITFRKLPESVKKRMPPIVILAHIYDPDPEKRFVFINDRRYRVGERINGKGAVLKEIVPEGVIVDYGDGLALVPIE